MCAHVERARVALLVPAAKKVGSAVVGRSRKKTKELEMFLPPSVYLLRIIREILVTMPAVH